MSHKVFNVGFSKTGTTSFERACIVLGYETYRGDYRLKHNDYLLSLYVNRDYDEIRRMTAYWDAYADAPWGGSDLYKKLVEWYPNAKFVQTIRNTESWYESLYGMLTMFDQNPETALSSCHAQQWYGFVYYLRHTFTIDNLVDNKAKICELYDRHNQEVMDFMRLQNVEFIQMDMANGDGWEKLCPFLGRDTPRRPFPHSNKKKSIVNNEE